MKLAAPTCNTPVTTTRKCSLPLDAVLEAWQREDPRDARRPSIAGAIHKLWEATVSCNHRDLATELDESECQIAAQFLLEFGDSDLLCRFVALYPQPYMLDVGAHEARLRVLVDIGSRWAANAGLGLRLASSLPCHWLAQLQPVLACPPSLSMDIHVDKPVNDDEGWIWDAILTVKPLAQLHISSREPFTGGIVRSLQKVRAQHIALDGPRPTDAGLYFGMRELLTATGATTLELIKTDFDTRWYAALLLDRKQCDRVSLKYKPELVEALLRLRNDLQIRHLELEWPFVQETHAVGKLFDLVHAVKVQHLEIHGAVCLDAWACTVGSRILNPEQTLPLQSLTACFVFQQMDERGLQWLQSTQNKVRFLHRPMAFSSDTHRVIDDQTAGRLASLGIQTPSDFSAQSRVVNRFAQHAAEVVRKLKIDRAGAQAWQALGRYYGQQLSVAPTARAPQTAIQNGVCAWDMSLPQVPAVELMTPATQSALDDLLKQLQTLIRTFDSDEKPTRRAAKLLMTYLTTGQLDSTALAQVGNEASSMLVGWNQPRLLQHLAPALSGWSLSVFQLDHAAALEHVRAWPAGQTRCHLQLVISLPSPAIDQVLNFAKRVPAQSLSIEIRSEALTLELLQKMAGLDMRQLVLNRIVQPAEPLLLALTDVVRSSTASDLQLIQCSDAVAQAILPLRAWAHLTVSPSQATAELFQSGRVASKRLTVGGHASHESPHIGTLISACKTLEKLNVKNGYMNLQDLALALQGSAVSEVDCSIDGNHDESYRQGKALLLQNTSLTTARLQERPGGRYKPSGPIERDSGLTAALHANRVSRNRRIFSTAMDPVLGYHVAWSAAGHMASFDAHTLLQSEAEPLARLLGASVSFADCCKAMAKRPGSAKMNAAQDAKFPLLENKLRIMAETGVHELVITQALGERLRQITSVSSQDGLDEIPHLLAQLAYRGVMSHEKWLAALNPAQPPRTEQENSTVNDSGVSKSPALGVASADRPPSVNASEGQWRALGETYARRLSAAPNALALAPGTEWDRTPQPLPGVELAKVAVTDLVNPPTREGLEGFASKLRPIRQAQLGMRSKWAQAIDLLEHYRYKGHLDTAVLSTVTGELSRLLLQHQQGKLLEHLAPLLSKWDIGILSPEQARGLRDVLQWPSMQTDCHLSIERELPVEEIAGIVNFAQKVGPKRLSLEIKARAATPALLDRMAGLDLRQLALDGIGKPGALLLEALTRMASTSTVTDVRLRGCDGDVARAILPLRRWEHLEFRDTLGMVELFESGKVASKRLTVTPLDSERMGTFITACKGLEKVVVQFRSVGLLLLSDALEKSKVHEVHCEIDEGTDERYAQGMNALRRNTVLTTARFSEARSVFRPCGSIVGDPTMAARLQMNRFERNTRIFSSGLNTSLGYPVVWAEAGQKAPFDANRSSLEEAEALARLLAPSVSFEDFTVSMKDRQTRGHIRGETPKFDPQRTLLENKLRSMEVAGEHELLITHAVGQRLQKITSSSSSTSSEADLNEIPPLLAELVRAGVMPQREWAEASQGRSPAPLNG